MSDDLLTDNDLGAARTVLLKADMVRRSKGQAEAVKTISRALLRAREEAFEEAAKIAEMFIINRNSIHPDVPFDKLSAQARNIAHTTCQHIAASIREGTKP